MAEEFDAIVIGAGEAGTTVASLAVEAGRRVAMIYRRPYGSTCLNVGCVPSKFLIHRARVAQTVRTSSRFGIASLEPVVDLGAIVAEKNAMIDEHRAESLPNAEATDALTLIEGAARFVSDHDVAVASRVLRAPRIFIATGMRPSIPAIEGLDRVRVLTNETMMDVASVPERLVVLGGGYVGCELGQAYRRFGAHVTIVHSREHLLPREEPDVSTVLEQAFESEGIELLLGYRTVRAEPGAPGVRLTLRAMDGTERVLGASHLLCATGRRPNTDELDLSAAGVMTDERGFVKVDAFLETNVPGIWAIGDVNGEQPFTRVCQEEAKVAYENAFQERRFAMEREYLGHAIFTDPEIGSVGLTEQAAWGRGHDVAVGLVTFDGVEKAELIGETAGFVKYVVDRQTHRVLGCHVIGPQAADLVYAAVLVMRHRGTLDELARAVGIFPTLQEAMEGTARGLLRKIAPHEVSGPLVGVPATHGAPKQGSGDDFRAREVTAMQKASFRCPACAADFETKEKLDQHNSKERSTAKKSGTTKPKR